MARRRSKNKHLPQRMYLKHGAYYFVEAGTERWIPLGREYAKAMGKYGEITDIDRPCVTMNDVIARYRIEVLPKKAATTQKGEAPQLIRLANWCGHVRPDEITTQQIYRYMDQRARKAPAAAKHEITLLHHIYVKAIRWGAASQNPVAGVEKPKSKPRDRYVTDQEFYAVRRLASPQVRVAMDLALLTGLRKGDLLNLTRDNLTEAGLLVQTSKTGKGLLFEYTPALEEVLAASKKLRPQVPGHYLIRNKQGSQYTPDGFSTNWQKLMLKAKDAGIERFTFHDIRSKSASDSASLGEASERLGHSSTALTKKAYYRKAMPVKPLR